MQHDWDKYFDTNTIYWQKIQKIYEENDNFPKKVVKNRNLHHKFMRSFSKSENEPIDNDLDNLVSLNLGDHFLIHYYLWKCAKKGYRSKCALAFTYMRKKMTKYIDDDTVEMMALDYAYLMKDVNSIHSIVGKRVLSDPNHPWHNRTKESLCESSKKERETMKKHYSQDELNEMNYRKMDNIRGKTYKEIYGEEKAKVLSAKRSESNRRRTEELNNKIKKIQIALNMDNDYEAFESLKWLYRYWKDDPDIIDRIVDEMRKWY